MRASQGCLLAVLLLAAGVAGCIGGEESTETGDDEDPSDPRQDSNQTTRGVQTLAASNATTRFLGVATFDGIDPATVEPFVPGNMTPIPCFLPDVPGTVDVSLVAETRTYEHVPGVEDPIVEVGLLACAERPDGAAREAANEVSWVGLMGWVDGSSYARFLHGIGFPAEQANLTMEAAPQGYTLSASTDEGSIVEGRFAVSPVGIPSAQPLDCEPSTQNGRSIVQATEDEMLAFDWNKTETICPAEAELTWPEESPLAEVLGPARTPTTVVDADVQEARYWWRVLPVGG